MIETEFYTINADVNENVLNLEVKGFWSARKMDSFKNYLEDLKKEIVKFNGKPFNLIADLSTFGTPPKEVLPLHIEAQKICVDVGMQKTAEIFKEFTIAQIATRRMAMQSEIAYRKVFN